MLSDAGQECPAYRMLGSSESSGLDKSSPYKFFYGSGCETRTSRGQR